MCFYYAILTENGWRRNATRRLLSMFIYLYWKHFIIAIMDFLFIFFLFYWDLLLQTNKTDNNEDKQNDKQLELPDSSRL